MDPFCPIPMRNAGVRATDHVPVLDVEAEVDVEVLVVVVVEDAGRLPRLPPVGLEVDARVVNDAMIVGVHHEDAHGGKVRRPQEQRRDQHGLDVQELDRVDGRHREGRRLFVRVVELVEVLVEERHVVQPVMPVRQVVLKSVLAR